MSRLALAFALLLSPAARADWPDFRGPTFQGHAPAGANPPTEWGPTKNVRWRTPTPHKGWSTPIVVGGDLWLTTATPDGHDFFVLRLKADTGAITLNEKLFHCDKPEKLGNPVNAYASPSPVAGGGRVFVHFGSYGTAALDAATGKVLWTRVDLPCRHYRGPGSSPVLWRDRLVLTMDGVDVQYTVALDAATGKTLWRTDRTTPWNDIGPDGKPKDEGDLRKSYSTPLVIEAAGREQLVSVGAFAVYSYDLETGKENWHAAHGSFSCSPRPVAADGVVYLSPGYGRSEVIALRADGTGDVTKTHVVWRTSRGAAKLGSPLLADGLLYLPADNGVVTCLDAKDGAEVWKERTGDGLAASLLLAGDRLYACDQGGRTTVLRAGREPEVLAKNQLPEGFMASPVVLGDDLILRTKGAVYRVGK